MKILQKLCSLNGLSGDESEVRAYILNQISPYCSGRVDPAGNILAFKKGRKQPKRKLLFEAHMDETGYIVTRIDSSGLLYLDSVGVSASVSVGKAVFVRATAEGSRMLPGVIGAVPLHLLEKEDRAAIPKMETLYVDIGAKDEQEARQFVVEGDSVYFDGPFGLMGNLVKGKALDDRIGCYNLIRMIQSDLEYDSYFAFCVQEEVGLRGAMAAAWHIRPDLTVVMETTTAADIGGVKPSDTVCCVGGGVAVSFADRGTIYEPRLVENIFTLARGRHIACQPKTMVSGGNDAAIWQKTVGGSRVVTFSAPTRYLHSPVGVASRDDIDGMFELAKAVNEEVDAL